VFKIPRGTRDFNPEQMQKRKYVEDSMRSTFQRFGYREIQTPMFETLELFTAKSGEEIISEIYSFTDKGGRELSLRPELTAPVIRFYIDKLQMEPKPLKLSYLGSCFRYDRPQKGRYREFKQAGCEIIGTDTPEAYAELIALAYKLLENTGLKNLRLNIGNLDILSSMYRVIKLSKDQQKYLTPLIDKSMFEDVFSALQDFNVSPKDATKFVEMLQNSKIKEVSEYIKNDKNGINAVFNLEKILNFLKNNFNITNFQIKISIVRGLDYYKGIVFEIEAPELGAEKQLCGGGAYELVSMFGGTDTPTAGFAIGFDRTVLALETEKFNFPVFKLDVFIVPVNECMIDKSVEITQSLRDQGINADIDLLRRDISKSLKYASSLNAKKAIIVGPKELVQDSVTIRDMESGKQEIVKIKDITNKFK
jgi:histidyl-tRNA synthetase